MKSFIIAEPFNGHNIFPLGLDGQDRAGIDVQPVHEDGARATTAVITGSLRAGEVEAISENVIKRPVRIDFELMDDAVNVQRDMVRLLALHLLLIISNRKLCAPTLLSDT
jgi:hypothetical protein